MLNLNRSKRDLFDRRRSLDNGNLNPNSMPSFNEHYIGTQLNFGNTINNQSKSAKRAELLSQLPASTKVSTVWTMAPPKAFQTEDIVHQYNRLMPFKITYESFSEYNKLNTFADNPMVNISNQQILYINLKIYRNSSNFI